VGIRDPAFQRITTQIHPKVAWSRQNAFVTPTWIRTLHVVRGGLSEVLSMLSQTECGVMDEDSAN
jgi:hypothetical protein